MTPSLNLDGIGKLCGPDLDFVSAKDLAFEKVRREDGKRDPEVGRARAEVQLGPLSRRADANLSKIQRIVLLVFGSHLANISRLLIVR